MSEVLDTCGGVDANRFSPAAQASSKLALQLEVDVSVWSDRDQMEERLDVLVDQTYKALLSVVETTAVNKRVLYRPPFTFLHKLLVETLERYGIFTPQQLVYAELSTKEDKAAFLTRALAFVGYVMTNVKEQSLSVLLFVSPIKVLAGVSVEDTLEFLQQLCVVCQSTDTEAKENAAMVVMAKGDAQLYTAGVAFRKGLVLVQAIVRAFISRRIGKRRAAGASGGTHGAKSGGYHYSTNGPVSMEVGTRFLKELANGRMDDGVIAAVVNKRYLLRYDEDAEAEDNVDEIEMKIILEESRRLQRLRERIHNSAGSRRSQATEDEEHLLTSLPDLSSVVGDEGGQPRPSKRLSSSRGLERMAMAGAHTRPLSTGFSGGTAFSDHQEEMIGIKRERLERVQSRELGSEDGKTNTAGGTEQASPLVTPHQEKTEPSVNGAKPWQASLKEILVRGHQPMVETTPSTITADNLRTSAYTKPASSNPGFVPSFPELSIPGTKKKLPVVQKRKQVVSSEPPTGARLSSKTKTSVEQAMPETSRAKASDHSHPPVPAHVVPLPMYSDTGVDRAFVGTYQSMDQKAQEKLILFREIVHRIDGYMKRKHLRVIDLFRFCDADGNGSVSPQEMIDTLSQMEIQLSPEQAHDFIHYIDKDGNGSIDIDEFEELVRVARRSEAQREQLKKELHHQKREGKMTSSTNRFASLIKNRQRILDELKQLDIGDVGTVSVGQAKPAILRMQLAGIDDALVNELMEHTIALSEPSPPAAPVAGDSTIHLHQLAKALYDLEWSKRSNRFLDPSWLAQFDSQLERAYRDFELL